MRFQFQNQKLLFVINDASFFLSHRLPLARAALKAGLEVHIALPRGQGWDEIQQDFHLHPIGFTRSSLNPFKELRCLLQLFSLYKRLKPRLLHHLTIKPVLYGSFLARFFKTSRVINGITGLGHVFAEKGLKNWALRQCVVLAYRISFKLPYQKIIFQNQDDQDFFINGKIAKKDQSVLIKGSGVDLNQFRPAGGVPDSPMVILASRMLWIKGIGEFVEAARRLRAQGINARFVLAGKPDAGNPTSISVEQLSAWNESGAVEWLGYCDQMAALLAKASVVVLPTAYREGVPKILIEAAAMGKPLIASDEPGCREIVQQGINGFLIPSRNADALEKALKALLGDKALREKMGGNSRLIAEKEFGLEHVIQRTFSVYQSLLTA